MTTQHGDLLEAAKQVREFAYAPYSGFAVGAALQTQSGVFVGCNVENVSLGLTICAERAAVAAALACGEQTFTVLALVTDSKLPAVPCGACRQVLAEFNPGLHIISSTTERVTEAFNLADLLPHPRQGILESHV